MKRNPLSRGRFFAVALTVAALGLAAWGLRCWFDRLSEAEQALVGTWREAAPSGHPHGDRFILRLGADRRCTLSNPDNDICLTGHSMTGRWGLRGRQLACDYRQGLER